MARGAGGEWEGFVEAEPKSEGEKTGDSVRRGRVESPHNSHLCLDPRTGKPCNGLGLQPALQHHGSPGGQADLNSEACTALERLLKASSADTEHGAAGNARGLLR